MFAILIIYILWSALGVLSTDWSVTTMTGLFNKVSNMGESWYDCNTGNSIMPLGDSTVLSLKEYKCSEGTCAHTKSMLLTHDLYGGIRCEDDNAQCILDGESSRRGMVVRGSGSDTLGGGTGSGKLTLRSLTFKNGKTDGEADGGAGVQIRVKADVDIELCVFVNNSATRSSTKGGGAIEVFSGTVNIIASTFHGNSAESEIGNDVYNRDGTVTVESVCPTPYSSNGPTTGYALDTYAQFGTISGSKFSYSDCYFRCGPGSYNPSGGISSSDCEACGAGKFSSSTGSTTCSDCAVGKHNSSPTATSCTVCPKGSYTETEGTASCPSCPAGRFNSDGANSASLHDSLSSCSICPAGKFNPDPGTNASLHDSCEACLPGKFNADNGVNVLVHDDVGDCFSCDVGKFSNDPNGATSCEVCREGLVSGSGASSCSTCPTGYQCVEGVVNSTCPAGRYSNGTREECSECVKGYKCPGGTDKIPCPPGSYSFSSSQHTCEGCEAGKFQSDEAKDGCLPCTPGHFCPASSVAPLPCLKGSTFQPDSSEMACKACSNCPLGEVMTKDCTITTDRQCSPCTAPSYSDDGFACKECDGEGQYNDKDGASFCKIAPAGTKPSANRTTVEPCPKNHFSIGANSTCTACPDGGHSQPGSSSCEKCSTGEYYNETSNECGICPKNTFTLSGATDISGCTPCQNTGEYAEPGSGYCKKCPQYEEFDELTGGCACMTSFERIDGTCTCQVGETLMGTSCSPCELGKWKKESGVKSCSRCEIILAGAITANRGSSEEGACICPMATYDNGEDKCVEIVEGIRNDIKGLTLETLTLFPGWWRASNTSDDIRECLISEACLGGNSTNMCRDGHTGPYCNVCVENYNLDPFGLCKECASSTMDLVLTITAAFSVMVLFFLFKFLVTKKLGKNGKGKDIWKKMKNGAKVIFASGQITASLPRVIPSLALPKSYKKVVEASQVFKLDIFTFVPIGCWTGGAFNYYNRTAVMTLPVIALCGTLFFLGILMKRRKNKMHTAAITVIYLTLPTITTTVFGLFPCDPLDDGREFLRADYHIRCDKEGRGGWEAFGIAMVVIFPVCVPALELFLLWRVKERIMKPVEEREKDNSIKDLIFLWDPYKPEFWYWEVAETTRRLGMTGLLSIIKPGTFTQLTTGLMMSGGYTVLLAMLKPYHEKRDNRIAILSSGLIEVTFMSSFLMKAQKMVEDSYEASGLGILLCVSSTVLVILFVVWGWKSFNDVGGGMSYNAKVMSALREYAGGKKEGGGIQMQDIYASEPEDGKTRSESVFGVSNPIGMAKGKVKEKGGTKGKDVLEKVTQEGSGEVDYCNVMTGETAWKKPE